MASISGDGTVILWPGNWKIVLEVAYNRLKQHPVFTKPEEIQNDEQRSLAIAAYETCKKYVWSKANSSNK